MHISSSNSQSGAALITGLIFLVVLTLISLSAIKSTSLEERMAGNARDQDVAFQGAEAGVREAMNLLGTSPPAASGFVAGCAAGLCENDPTTPVWTTITANNAWTSSTTRAYSGTPLTIDGSTQLATQPRYIVELITGTSAPAGESASVGGGSSGTTTTSYRITARGWGLTNQTQATVQATFTN
ncbi:MAG: PilX N-terminal domain-containing pilus assembly protein [Thiobacillus sp.]|nr:PilX N-terminal domain-containing pilus assembly protein [Thiobacillus sp.]